MMQIQLNRLVNTSYTRYLCTYLILQVHKIEAAWNIGILIVEKDGSTNTDDSNVVQLFCLKCYPSLYNFTQERSNATRYNLSSLMDLNSVDSCDKEAYPQSGIQGKVMQFNPYLTVGNFLAVSLNLDYTLILELIEFRLFPVCFLSCKSSLHFSIYR